MPSTDRLASSAIRLLCGLFLGLTALLSLPAAAQTATTVGIFPSQEAGNRIKKAREVSPYGPTVMGDSFGAYSGALSFSHMDAAVPGNSGLSVSVGRSFSADAGRMPLEYSERFTDNWHAYQGLFGDWELELPHLSGTYSEQQGWVVQTANATARCSTPTDVGSMYPPAILQGDLFRSHVMHSGVNLHLPGGGSEPLTLRMTDSPYPKPVDTAYRWQTQSNWVLSCLPSLQSSVKYSGVGSRGGEGFLAVSPDGTKYRFDWMVEYAEKQVKQLTWTQTTGAHGTFFATEHKLPRVESRIYPTRVEDRFGNWVNYTWSGKRLMSITASDGRSITLTYNAQNRVATVTAAGVTTTYGYNGNGSLTSVTRADGSQWTFNFGALWTHHRFAPIQFNVEHIANYEEYYMCAPGRLLNPNPVTLSMTSPSGASGSFQLHFRRHYRDAAEACLNTGHANNWMDWNNVPGNPTMEEIPTHLWGNVTPMQLELLMLTSKTLTGSNLPANQTWGFAYQTLTDGQYELKNVRRKVTVTKPDGNTEESIFGANHLTMRWEEQYPVGTPPQQPDEGKLLSHRVLQGGVELSKTENTYMPFPEELASSPSGYDSPFDPWVGACVCDSSPTRQPLKQQRITQQGATFTRTIDTFDEYARPVDVTRTSVIAGVTKSRTDKTEYHDNRTHWVIGQVARTSTTALGGSTQTARTEFSPLAQPITFLGMGENVIQRVTYHADGSPHTVKDGKGNTTTLTSWHRGIPTVVTFADTKTQSAEVNDAGWITKVTDQKGVPTTYGYDSMGRLASIIYTPDPSVTWNQTTLSFAKTTQVEVGFPIGTWRQQIQTGNGIKRTYFDAMWRPRVSHEYDSGNLAGTSRYSAWAYDHEGRTTFTAYPLAAAASLASFTQGVDTFYDAMGRVTSTTQDSEIGGLTVLTEYLADFKVRTTNPRGKSTTTSFLAWDQPETSMPLSIQAPAGVTTTITRDGIGRSTQVTRAGTWSGAAISANRYYRYNTKGQLERSLSSEERSTYFDYDLAGNVLHTYHCGDNTDAGCGWTSAGARPADRTTMTYDVMNRVTLVDYPSGTNDVATTYHDDGAVATVVSGIVTREFNYNNRGMLDNEWLKWNANNWQTSYGYNANGHQATLTYRDGHQVSFAPNALGQATQAGTYATGVSYFPNGALKQFTYGNGIVHTLTQNARQLPERSRDMFGATAILDDTYDYDQNGNVAGITDALSGQAGNRDMTYDDLDRLVGVTAGAAQGGNAVFAYDVLDNIRQLDQGTRTVRHQYDGTNRLISFKNAAGTTVSSYTNDTRGNLIQRVTGAVTDTYTFDKANRLKTASIGGVAYAYAYDGLGLRMHQVEAGVSSYFVYSQAGQLLFSQDGVNRYNHILLGGSLVAKRLVPFDGSATTIRYQHTDALGSPVVETNEAGGLLPRERMTAYGEPADGTWQSGPGYTGHQMDANSKLVYMQQRYYDPVIGRFLSADPVATSQTSGANFNRYWYANNNPYKFTDPDGRLAASESWLGGPCDLRPCTKGPDGVRSLGPFGDMPSEGGGYAQKSGGDEEGENATDEGDGSTGDADKQFDPLGAVLGIADMGTGVIELATGGGLVITGIVTGTDDGVFGVGVGLFGALTAADGFINFQNAIDGGNRESAFVQFGGAVLGAEGAKVGGWARILTPTGAAKGVVNIAKGKAGFKDLESLVRYQHELEQGAEP